MSLSRFRRCLVAVAATVAASVAVPSLVANAATAGAGVPRPASSGVCPPSAYAVGFSDALDKKVVDGAALGGLSNIAYDPQLHSYASTVDNHADDPSRIWFYDNTIRPHLTRAPLVLKQPDGNPYTGMTADNEGLAVLPNGDFLVSSEVEPSIRIFGRDGVQSGTLPVPARFRVAPAGEATANATLEGLTISRDGRQIVASMEGTLSGDMPASGAPADYRRFLVYGKGSRGWTLDKQVGYRVDDGNRIAEVQEYASGKLLVLEAAFTPAVGNTIQLYAVTGLSRAVDVTNVANLSTAPQQVMHKKLIADVTGCPTLGAQAKQPQTNPLMDNYEGMTTTQLIGPAYAVSLVSDDNFGATQITRFLTLAAILP